MKSDSIAMYSRDKSREDGRSERSDVSATRGRRKEEETKTLWREGREGGRERRGCSGGRKGERVLMVGGAGDVRESIL